MINIWGTYYHSIISKEGEILLTTILLCLISTSTFYNYYKIGIFVCFSIIFFIILLYIIYDNIKKNGNQPNIQNKKLLSFRAKELEKLKYLLESPSISTVLIEAEIGFGKTYLIESFIMNSDSDYEVIYLKLPLIKNVDYLKKIILDEFFKILKKNKIFIKKEDIFFQNLDTIKFSCFEFKKNSIQSNWDSINELKNSLEILRDTHRKKILIILDDIEREDNSFKIKHSLIFLGELADYLKNTDVTFLFLAQENVISPILNKNNSINLLEKYFNYKIKLFSPKFENLKKEDIEILFKDTFSDFENIPEKNIEEHSIFILELLRVLKLSLSTFLTERNVVIKNENIRSISNFIFYFEESIRFETLNLNSNLVWRYIYKSLEIFLPDLLPNDTKNIDDFIYEALRNKSLATVNLIPLESAKDTQASIKFFYLKGGLPSFYNKVNIEKILKYINDSSIQKVDFSLQISGLDISYLIDNISEKNLERFLLLNLSFEFQITHCLIKIFNKAKSFDFIIPIALKYFFVYLKTEIELHKFYSLFYTGEVYPDFDFDGDGELNNEKKEMLTQFVNLISEHERYLKSSLPNFDIGKILVSLNEHITNPYLNGEYPEVD